MPVREGTRRDFVYCLVLLRRAVIESQTHCITFSSLGIQYNLKQSRFDPGLELTIALCSGDSHQILMVP